MPHKITLTGTPISIESHKKYFCIFMEEGGSAAAPKGLPVSSKITYRVFVNQKQLNKAGLTSENIVEKKLLVQGEPVLGAISSKFKSEIGVVCFQLQVLEVKEKEKKEKTDIQSQQLTQPDKPASHTISNNQPKKINLQPVKGTSGFISAESIQIPESWDKTGITEEQLEAVKSFIEQNRTFEFPLSINKKTTEMLVEKEYIWIVAAKDLLVNKVPIKWIVIPESRLPEGTDKVMLIEDILVPDSFLAARPGEQKLEKIQSYYQENGRLDAPITINQENTLVDGYSRFYFLKQKKEFKIPVRIK